MPNLIQYPPVKVSVGKRISCFGNSCNHMSNVPIMSIRKRMRSYSSLSLDSRLSRSARLGTLRLNIVRNVTIVTREHKFLADEFATLEYAGLYRGV